MKCISLLGVSPLLYFPPLRLSVDTVISAAICHLSATSSHFLFLCLSQPPALCDNPVHWALCQLCWLEYSPYMAAPSQLGIFVHFLTQSLHKRPSCSLLPLCTSPQSGIPLTPARLESSWNGARTAPLSAGCLAVEGDKPGTCHRDKVVFAQQGNQWGWTASKHPASCKLANIH